MSARRKVAILVCALSALSRGGRAQESSLRGLAIDERLGGEICVLPGERLPPWGLVRLQVPRTEVERAPGVFSFEALDERLSALADGRVLLALEGTPRTVQESEPFREYILGLSARYRGRIEGYVVEHLEGPLDFQTHAFLLKLAAIQIHSVDHDAVVLASQPIASEPEWVESLYREGIAPYLDGWAFDGADDLSRADFDERLNAIGEVVEEEDPSAVTMVTGFALDEMLVDAIANLAAGAPLTTFSGCRAAVDAFLQMPKDLTRLLSSNVVGLDSRESEVGFGVPGVIHRVLFDTDSGSTYVAYWSGVERPDLDSVEVTAETFVTDPPSLLDPLGGAPPSLSGFAYDPERRIARFKAPVRGSPLILEFHTAAFGTRVDAEVGLDVDEIITRHQQAQRRQDDLVENYIASVTDAIHFRPTPTEAFDVVVESRFYFDKDASEWEEVSFSFNGARWGADRPPFPLLQPEKVLSLPLDLRLDRDYRYELVGRDKVGERNAYVIRFTPIAEERTLYRGIAFIDEETFLKLKVESVQTSLSPPVVSSDEVYGYQQQVVIGDVPIYLLTSLESKQLMLIAGRNLLVEKESRFQGFDVNPHDFAEQRQRARDSEHIMLKDTDAGLRYFVKKGGERQISEELTQSARAFALGVILDPSFDFPIPIFGFNYLDFDFLETDSQFALLFGGVFALGNLQKSDLFGGRFDTNLDFFVFGIPSNDVVFDADGKVEEEALTTVPASLGASFGFQATTFQKLTGRYDLRYDYYGESESASDDFVTPASTFTHGVGLGYEYRRGGYSLVASGSFNRRASWDAWGNVETFDPATESYWKYRATLGKDFFFGTIHKVHLDGGLFGGERLDRFTKYQFGLFDETRVHGMPSTAVRFAKLALARASYSFNVLDQFRFEAFFDQAWGDDEEQDLGWVKLYGIGIAMNFRGPRRTVVRLDFGKSFLPEALRGAGTMVGQVQILKPF